MSYIKGALSSPGFQKEPFHYLQSVHREYYLSPKIKEPEISQNEMVQYFHIDNKSCFAPQFINTVQ